MTGGAALSTRARERERARACKRAAWPGVAGPVTSGHGRARVGHVHNWAASAGKRDRTRLGRAFESLSLVLIINDTKLLMPCVKCFELGISNTCDEGACGKEWWP
jgi:hypothetical protein